MRAPDGLAHEAGGQHVQVFHSRWGRLLATVVAAAAIIAMLVVDSVTIASRRHTEAVRAAARRAARARVTYLEAVRAPLTDLYRQTQPLADAFAARNAGTAGIDFPVRDVLAHTTIGPAVRADLAAIVGRKPPAGLTVPAEAVVSAVRSISSVVAGLGSQAAVTGQPLADDFTGGPFATLDGLSGTLTSAVADLYGPQMRPVPPTFGTGGAAARVPVAASHDSWLLAAGTACLAGELQLDSGPTQVKTLAQLQAAVNLESTAATSVTAAIRRATLPTGDTKAHALVGQLSVVDRQVAVDKQLLTAIAAQNSGQVKGLLDQGIALDTDLNALGKAFGVYGSTTCSAFFSSGGPSPASAAGGGSATTSA